MLYAGPILSVLVILLVARLLLQKHNTHAVLLFAGIGMLLAAYWLGLEGMKLRQSTGNAYFDIFAALKEAFSKTNAGVGLMIMAIGGFVAYMDHIGASDVLVYWAMKPLKLFRRQPHIAASLVIPIGQVLFVAIPSAAGLALLLMASLYPILTRLGLSKVSAVSVITASTVFGIGPACATTASAIEIMKMDTILYFLEYQIPMVWPLTLCLMISYYLVNRYYDRKHGASEPAAAEAAKKPAAPAIYAVLPILPIALLMVFSDLSTWIQPPIVLDTSTVMFLSFFVALLFEAIRHRRMRHLGNSFNVFWTGMADIFKSVVTLIIAAEIFAQGLILLGFIDGLLSLTQTMGLGKGLVGMVLTTMIFLASMLMGSGNAAFFAFGPLVPGLAGSIGMATTTLMLPMQLAASMGRAVSPVAGVLIATAQIAGISTLDIVKRNLIPMVSTLLLMFLLHFI
jgi:DcuC family C4-dicarboxylate transporter